MTLAEIHFRMEYLLKKISRNPEDQNCWYTCELEIAYLEQLREQLEEH